MFLQPAKEGFSVLELLMAILVFGIISAFAITKYGDVKEQAYIDAMMNDLRNFALLQEQIHQERDTFIEVDSLQAAGYHFSSDVSADSVDIGTGRFYLKVVHAKTDRYCELDYARSIGTAARNKIECPGGGGGEESSVDLEPVAQFTVSDSTAGGSPDAEESLSVNGGTITTINASPGQSAGKFGTGRTLRFDGTGSYDPEGEPISSYSWSFGDGTVATGPVVYRRYTSKGDYEVTLEVATEDQAGVMRRPLEIEAAIESDGLVAAWDPCLGKGTQYWLDALGKHHGVLGDSEASEAIDPIWSNNPLGVYQDALGQHITIPSLSGSGFSHTFIFTLWGPNVGGYPTVLRAGSLNFYVGYNGSSQFAIHDGSWRTASTPNDALFDGEPHQVAMVLNSETNQANFYLDGAFHSSTTYGGNTGISAATILRNDNTSTHNWLGGGVGATLYYNRALTAEEISYSTEALAPGECTTEAGAAYIEVTPEEKTIALGREFKFDAVVWDSMWFPIQAEMSRGLPETVR